MMNDSALGAKAPETNDQNLFEQLVLGQDASKPAVENTTQVAPLPEPNPIKDAAAFLSEHPAMAQASRSHSASKPNTDKRQPATTNQTMFLPATKQVALQQQLASMIKDYAQMGKSAEEARAVLQANWQALSVALNPHGALADQAASFLTDALNGQLTHEGCHVPKERQMQSIFSIFTKRQAEASAAVQLLQDTQFIANAITLSQQTTPMPDIEWYNAKKQEEIIAEIGTDNPPHVLANALGQHMQHKAIADTFKLNGPLEAPLIKAMHQANPQISVDAIQGFAKNWLHDRFHRSQKVADVTKPATGELACKAMCRATEKIAKQYGVTPMPKAANDSIYKQPMNGHHEVTLADHQGTVASQPTINQTPSV